MADSELRGAASAEPIQSVEVITDTDRFMALAGEWNDAAERAALPHPFLHHEWLRTWWSCFHAGRRLHIVVVRSNGAILAIAPLMVETAPMYRIPVRRLRLIENDHTPRTDIIVTGRADAAYRAVWNALDAQRDEWDVLQISQVARESGTLPALTRLAQEGGCTTGLWHGEESPYVALGQRWADYERGLSSKFRGNLRNRLARLERLGRVSFEVLDDAGAIEQAQPDALRLEPSGWKSGEGTAIVSMPETKRFYTTLAFDAARGARIKQLFLGIDGRRIATAYAAEYRDRLFLLKTGFDTTFAKCAPFKLLTQFAIRDACDRGLGEFDFLGRAEPWKLEWTERTRPHDWLFIFSPRWRSRLVHQLKFRMAPAVKRYLH